MAFSFKTCPASVYILEGSNTTLLSDNESPVTIVFDGSHVRFYYRGQVVVIVPAKTECVEDRNSILVPYEEDGTGPRKWLAIAFGQYPPDAENALNMTIAKLRTVCVVEPAVRWGDHTGRYIEQASVRIAQGVAVGAQKVSQLITTGSVYLRQRIEPSQPIEIPQAVKSGVAMASAATKFASTVMGAAVSAAMTGIGSLSERYLPSMQPDPGSQMAKVMTASARAIGTVFDELNAAKTVITTTVKEEASGLVAIKYGTDAGIVTANALEAITVANQLSSAIRLRTLAMKGVQTSVATLANHPHAAAPTVPTPSAKCLRPQPALD